jgi:hypothetical protein
MRGIKTRVLQYNFVVNHLLLFRLNPYHIFYPFLAFFSVGHFDSNSNAGRRKAALCMLINKTTINRWEAATLVNWLKLFWKLLIELFVESFHPRFFIVALLYRSQYDVDMLGKLWITEILNEIERMSTFSVCKTTSVFNWICYLRS